MSKTIAIFIHQPYCSIQSANGIIKSIGSHYNYKIFTRHELEDNFFDDVDVVCFPGGIGEADKHDFLFRDNGERLKRFINNGGYYLGICMGAYWAGQHYFKLLEDVQVHQYIRRPTTTIRRYYSTTVPIKWQDHHQRMFFYDGPVFTPLTNWAKSYETIATYPNGEAMAIIQDRIGLIGCHPEAQEFWHDKPYLKRNYVNNNHLLKDFVNRLVK